MTWSALSFRKLALTSGIGMENRFDGKRIKMGLKRRECVQGMFRESCPDGHEKKIQKVPSWVVSWEQASPLWQVEVLPYSCWKVPLCLQRFINTQVSEIWFHFEVGWALSLQRQAHCWSINTVHEGTFICARQHLNAAHRQILSVLYFLLVLSRFPQVRSVCTTVLEVLKTFSWVKHFHYHYCINAY